MKSVSLDIRLVRFMKNIASQRVCASRFDMMTSKKHNENSISSSELP
jgi:hypothetical protein